MGDFYPILACEFMGVSYLSRVPADTNGLSLVSIGDPARLHTRKSHIPNPAGIRVMCAMRDVCLGHDTNTHTNELSILQLDIRMVDVVT